MMERRPLVALAEQMVIAFALGQEEEAWYRRDAEWDSTDAIEQWIRSRGIIYSVSGSPLGDEEDAWARP